MSDPQLDTLEYSRDACDEAPRAVAFKAKTRPEAEAWQNELRTALVELIGGFPADRSDLSPRVVETEDFATYTRETVLFRSRPNMSVYGYFLTPKRFEAPGPAILCLHGHGRGVDDIVGIRKDGGVRARQGGYQRDFALQCVNRGYAVLAIEQLGFGHRRDEATRGRGVARSSCQPASGAALLLGQTMIGWRVWDAMRSLDYLATRPEVDMGRVGVMGISGGGATTFFSAALDDRVKVAVVSGYFNTFRDSALSIAHCMDNYIPACCGTPRCTTSPGSSRRGPCSLSPVRKTTSSQWKPREPRWPGQGRPSACWAPRAALAWRSSRGATSSTAWARSGSWAISCEPVWSRLGAAVGLGGGRDSRPIAEVHGVEPRVEASVGHELGVGAGLHDAPVVQHDDLIGVGDRGEAVGYDQ